MRFAAALLAFLLLAGCEQAERSERMLSDADGGPPAVSRVTEEGPVKVTVSLSPQEPRLGDPLSLTLSVEAQPGVSIEMPAFGEALGRFSILDFTPRRETGPDGATTASHRYTLQAPMSGTQRVPPLRIEYLDARPDRPDAGEDEYRELLSEELSVEIASVLPQGELSGELRPPRPALPELRGATLARSWPWLLLGIAALAALWWAFRGWQRRTLEQRRVTAHERALGRLERLEAQGLPEGEASDAWYVELSDIVRRYIEDQYSVRAPELTTEEFLQEAQKSAELSGARRELLSAFLERCDRVKFAAYSPPREESREALALARRFLGEPPVVAEHRLQPAV